MGRSNKDEENLRRTNKIEIERFRRFRMKSSLEKLKLIMQKNDFINVVDGITMGKAEILEKAVEFCQEICISHEDKNMKNKKINASNSTEFPKVVKNSSDNTPQIQLNNWNIVIPHQMISSTRLSVSSDIDSRSPLSTFNSNEINIRNNQLNSINSETRVLKSKSKEPLDRVPNSTKKIWKPYEL